MSPDFKLCKRCEIEKPVTEFYKDNSKKDGLSTYCKSCMKEKGKIRHKNNPKYYLKQINRNPHKIWVRRTLVDHKLKNYIINITTGELEELAKKTKYCSICGDKLKWRYGTGLKDNSPTLDRKENGSIINKDNILIICWLCNTTKSKRTLSDFIIYCKKVTNKFQSEVKQDVSRCIIS